MPNALRNQQTPPEQQAALQTHLAVAARNSDLLALYRYNTTVVPNLLRFNLCNYF